MNRISNKTKENRGYGKGEGKNYKPYIQAHEFNSQGTAVTLRDWITSRSVELLSQGEAEYWHILRFNDDIIDIREQIPLPKEDTTAIAEEMGCEPAGKGRTTMTSDFFIVYADQHMEVHSFKKNMRSIERQRTLELLNIEKTFWERKNVSFRMVFGTDINHILASNIRVCSYYYEESSVFDETSCLKHLIIRKKIDVDLTKEKIDIPVLRDVYRKEIAAWMKSREM